MPDRQASARIEVVRSSSEGVSLPRRSWRRGVEKESERPGIKCGGPGRGAKRYLHCRVAVLNLRRMDFADALAAFALCPKLDINCHKLKMTISLNQTFLAPCRRTDLLCRPLVQARWGGQSFDSVERSSLAASAEAAARSTSVAPLAMRSEGRRQGRSEQLASQGLSMKQHNGESYLAREALRSTSARTVDRLLGHA